MRALSALLIPLALLAACDGGGGTGPDAGPVRLTLSNARQTVATAARPAPVTGRVTRAGMAAASWHLVTPLHAQTGAPAPGVEVCWMLDPQTNAGGPKPDEVCRRSDAQGAVSFAWAAGTREGRYVHRSCTRVDSASPCEVQDSAVFVVIPRPPAATTLSVGLVEQRGAGAGDTLAFMDPKLFTDSAGNTAAFRVQGTQWLKTVGDTVGTRSARILVAEWRGRSLGDTATVTFHSATKQVAAARAVLVHTFPDTPNGGAIIELTYTAVDVP